MALMVEGRRGQPQEFTEFQIVAPTYLCSIVAQKSDAWFIYLVEPGEKGAVRTLGQRTTKGAAVEAAQEIAKAVEFVLTRDL